MRPFIRSAIAESVEAKSRARTERKCADCGKVFLAYVRGARQARCPECQAERLREASREYQRRLRAKRSAKWRAPRKCVVCGKEFMPRNSLQRRCSPECALRKAAAPGGAKDPSASSRTVVCAVCGKTFSTGSRARICCSPQCSVARQRGKVRAARRKAREAAPRRNAGWDADGKHRRFREAAMRREPWRYEFADSPDIL